MVHISLALGPAMWTIFIVVIGIIANAISGAKYTPEFLVPAITLSILGVSSHFES